MYFTVPPNGVAKLHFGAHFQAPGLSRKAAVLDFVGLGHVRHEVGGRAEPVAAGEEQLSAGRQVVGAHDVPRVRRQGQGVAVHAHSRGVRGQNHAAPLLGRTVQFDSETSVGPRICSPMAATTSKADCYLQGQGRLRDSELVGKEAVYLCDGVVEV